MHRNLKIQLIAPSGYPHDQAAVRRGVERLEAAGHAVVGKDALQRIDQRFAGSVAERVAELNALGTDPSVDIALAIRGGYGAHQLLEHLDYAGLGERLGSRPLAMVGHSDFTAVQLALLARSNLVTFGGPMLSADFGAEALRDFTWRHFWKAMCSPTMDAAWSAAPDSPDVDVEGTLWGGNLAVVCALVGTPYMPVVDGGILFVEDISEPPFPGGADALPPVSGGYSRPAEGAGDWAIFPPIAAVNTTTATTFPTHSSVSAPLPASRWSRNCRSATARTSSPCRSVPRPGFAWPRARPVLPSTAIHPSPDTDLGKSRKMAGPRGVLPHHEGLNQ